MALIESDTRFPGIPSPEPITVRPMTLRDHLEIETEGATSPAQRPLDVFEQIVSKGKLLKTLRRDRDQLDARIGNEQAEFDRLVLEATRAVLKAAK